MAAAALRDRARRAMLASFVADASEMGSHWIYSPEELRKTLAAHWDAPEFHEPPSCPFYGPKEHPGYYASGSLSPYGHESEALLTYMASEGGDFVSGERWAQHIRKWAAGYGGRKNHATSAFEENVAKLDKEGKADKLFPAAGADDAQANVFWKVAQIASRYLGADDEVYLNKVEEAVRAHQNRDDAVEFALAYAKMMRVACTGEATVSDAIRAGAEGASDMIKSNIEKAFSGVVESVDAASDEAVQDYLNAYSDELFKEGDNERYRGIKSRTCSFPQSFVVGLKLALDADLVRDARAGESGFDAFVFAIRRNIRAGGDTIGRAPIIAGLMAATGSQPPAEWVQRTTDYAKYAAAGDTLAAKI